MDRTYVTQQGKRSVHQLGLDLWRDEVGAGSLVVLSYRVCSTSPKGPLAPALEAAGGGRASRRETHCLACPPKRGPSAPRGPWACPFGDETEPYTLLPTSAPLTQVARHPSLQPRLISYVLEMISADREGNVLERSLVRDCTLMWMDLGPKVYLEDFEASTASIWGAPSGRWSETRPAAQGWTPRR